MVETSESGMSLLQRLYNVVRSNLKTPQQGHTSSVDAHENVFSAPLQQDSEEACYYANLELAVGASFPEIKAAYRRLLSEYHPDKHALDPNKAKTAEELSKGLNQAMDYFEKRHKGGRQ